MILEEATYESFGYEVFELPRRSNKLIIAACEICGEFKVTSKHHYRTFCFSCGRTLNEANKGKKNSNYGKIGWNRGKATPENTKEKISKAVSGKKNGNWKGGKTKRTCLTCG